MGRQTCAFSIAVRVWRSSREPKLIKYPARRSVGRSLAVRTSETRAIRKIDRLLRDLGEEGGDSAENFYTAHINLDNYPLNRSVGSSPLCINYYYYGRPFQLARLKSHLATRANGLVASTRQASWAFS